MGLNKEIISETIFPTEIPMCKGVIAVAPPEAVAKRDELRKTWLATFSIASGVDRNLESPRHEFPMVSMGQTTLNDGTVAFYVRQEIVYKQNPYNTLPE